MGMHTENHIDTEWDDLVWEEPEEVNGDLYGLTITANPPIGPVQEDHHRRNGIPKLANMRRCHRYGARFAELDYLRTAAICNGLLDDGPMLGKGAA